MEPISLALVAAAAGRVVDHLLGEQANRAVAAVVGGIIGNRADRAVSRVLEGSQSYFENLRTQDPALNHDLERATREAYLLATQELIRQAELRLAMRGAQLLTAGDADALASVRRGIRTDLNAIDDAFPTGLPHAYLLAADPGSAPADRLARLRGALRENLTDDLRRWLGQHDRPPVVDDLLRSGWIVTTRQQRPVPRDWDSLVALAFVEKLKTTPRVAVVFEARLLSQIAAREPTAAPIATLEGFTASLDAVVLPLQRIEDSLGLLHRDVTAIKNGVENIRSDVGGLGRNIDALKDRVVVGARVPRVVVVSSVLTVVAFALLLTTEAGARAACRVPGIRLACGHLAIGGVPTADEMARWHGRPPGNCDALRSYLHDFGNGAYVAEARRLLDTRINRSVETWSPQQRTLPFTQRTSAAPAASEARARTDAMTNAGRDARIVCAPYSQGEFRLRATRVLADSWRCTSQTGRSGVRVRRPGSVRGRCSSGRRPRGVSMTAASRRVVACAFGAALICVGALAVSGAQPTDSRAAIRRLQEDLSAQYAASVAQDRRAFNEREAGLLADLQTRDVRLRKALHDARISKANETTVRAQLDIVFTEKLALIDGIARRGSCLRGTDRRVPAANRWRHGAGGPADAAGTAAIRRR